jgi:hypothetical protein
MAATGSTTRYMFARPSSHAYICLRCQARLLRPQTNVSLVASAQRSPFSAAHPRSSPPGDNEVSPVGFPHARDHKPDNGEQRDVEVPDKPLPGSGGETTTKYSSRKKSLGKGSWYVLGKVRGRPGGETREGSTALSIDSLGKPTEIILLRDLGFEQAEKEEAEDYISVDKHVFSREAIFKSIEDEKLQLDQDKINAQIDRLRPSASGSRYATNAITAEEYAKLGKKLAKSYTSNHLQEYCRMTVAQRGEQEGEGSAEQAATASRKISLTWSPWRRGTTPIGQRPPQATKHISLIRNWKSYGKTALISIIVQSIWNVHIASEQDGEVGELEVRLKPWEIDLFTAGSKHRNFL